MKKFIVIYHATGDAMKQIEKGPEDHEKSMEAWMQWAKKCGDKLVDLGAPLGFGTRLSPDNSGTPSDKGVVGYSVLQAENFDEAKALLKDHPHLGWSAECSIELHETLPMPGE